MCELRDAFAAVSEGKARYAMIPVENSVAGRVADVHLSSRKRPLHYRRTFRADPPPIAWSEIKTRHSKASPRSLHTPKRLSSPQQLRELALSRVKTADHRRCGARDR